jgi:putative transposase
MLLGFKTQLALNNKQRTLAARHAGVARHAYNWGLAICKQAVEAKQKLPTAKCSAPLPRTTCTSA